MIRIAIVEDDKIAAETLGKYLNKWSKEEDIAVTSKHFVNALDFLDEFKAEYDLVFMDIEMPHLDGMKAAESMRKVDSCALLVFVTNMRQYAIKGYAVDALDFIVKPVGYSAFATLMNKVQKILNTRESRKIMVKSTGGIKKIAVNSILYIEVYKHRMTYHTLEGNVEVWGSLSDAESLLPPECFARCNIGISINLQHVKAIEGDEVLVGSTRLAISRLKKKEFIASVARYMGNTI